MGGGRRRRRRQARQPVRDYRRQRSRPEPSDDVAARYRGVRAPLARVRLARHRRRRPRSECAARCICRSARHERPSDDDRRPDHQGQRGVVRRREGGLARQGLQEGRRGRPRPCRAGAAARAGAARHRHRSRNSEAAGPIGSSRRRRKRRRPRPTRWATRSPRARRTASRSPSWAKPTPAWLRSTPT